MSDLETLLERSLTAAMNGAEAGGELIERAHAQLARRNRTQHLLAAVASGLAAAAVIIVVVVIAQRPPDTHNLRPAQTHHTIAAPTRSSATSDHDLGPALDITSINRRPFLHPRHITVKARQPFRLTIHNNIYTIDAHEGIALPGPGIVPSRYFPRPGPGIRGFGSEHNVFSAPATDRILAGTSQTFNIPALPPGRYVIYCTLDAWTNLVAR
jgi:hypothetical protein